MSNKQPSANVVTKYVTGITDGAWTEVLPVEDQRRVLMIQNDDSANFGYFSFGETAPTETTGFKLPADSLFENNNPISSKVWMRAETGASINVTIGHG